MVTSPPSHWRHSTGFALPVGSDGPPSSQRNAPTSSAAKAPPAGRRTRAVTGLHPLNHHTIAPAHKRANTRCPLPRLSRANRVVHVTAFSIDYCRLTVRSALPAVQPANLLLAHAPRPVSLAPSQSYTKVGSHRKPRFPFGAPRILAPTPPAAAMNSRALAAMRQRPHGSDQQRREGGSHPQSSCSPGNPATPMASATYAAHWGDPPLAHTRKRPSAYPKPIRRTPHSQPAPIQNVRVDHPHVLMAE